MSVTGCIVQIAHRFSRVVVVPSKSAAAALTLSIVPTAVAFVVIAVHAMNVDSSVSIATLVKTTAPTLVRIAKKDSAAVVGDKYEFSNVYLLMMVIMAIVKCFTFVATAPRRNKSVVNAVASAVGFIVSLANRVVSFVIIALEVMKQP
jgi:hypothetical protein